MLDEDSTRFLVCKKIAQLVKLINHLNSQIADTQHEVDCITTDFEEDLKSLLRDHTDNLNKSGKLLKFIEDESQNSYKSKYKDNYDHIYLEYEQLLVDCQSDLTEVTVSVSSDLSKITSYINSIDNELESNLKQLDEIIEQMKSHYSDQIEKLNQSYKDEIITLDDESKVKLNKLQEKTSKKLDMLDRDFNRSLNNLKSKFGQTNPLINIKIENEEKFNSFRIDQVALKEFITATKEEINFLISTAKAVLKEQIQRKNKALDSFKEMTKTQKKELEKTKNCVQINIKAMDDEYSKTKNDFENQQKEMSQTFENLRKAFVNLTKSDLNEIQEQQLLFQLSSRKSSESVSTMINDINQQIKDKKAFIDQHRDRNEKLFSQLDQDAKKLENGIQEKNEELLKIKEVHQSEECILSKSQKSAIDDLILMHQKEIDKLNQKINLKTENIEINKQIEENRNLYNSLCFEKAQLLADESNTDDPEILEAREKYDNEIKKLEDELKNEFENTCNEEKLLIEACSESHRNEMFQINTDIAQKYDEHLQSIRDSFMNRNFKEEDEKINSEYEKQLFELQKKFDALEKNDTIIKKPKEEDLKAEKELESLNRIKKEKEEQLENEKNIILNNFLQKQKIEEDEYLRKMAEINYNSNINQVSHSNEYEKIRSQYHTQIQKLNIRIKELKEELDSLRNATLCVEKISSDFDIDEKKMRDSLNELRAKSDIKISKAIYKADLKKSEVLKKIDNFKKKFNRISTMAKQDTDQSSAILKDAEEKAKEESKNLQQKVAHAISRLIKHFTKEKDKMNKKFSQKFEELKKLVDEQKNEIDTFTNESSLKEKESQENYEKEIQLSESNSTKELELLRAENDKKIQDLEDQNDQIRQKIEQFKLGILNCKSRDEELQIIERLERQLSIKDKHIKDINDDISDCKTKIIQQEDVYNSHFGMQPSVAVFRPTTGIVPIPINLRLKQQQRPVSAAVKVRPMSTFLKNKTKKNDVSFNTEGKK